MNGLKVSYLKYPIYGLGTNDKYVVTSGGGGGKSYGIEDILDINTFNEEEKKLQPIYSTTEQNGVIDCILYNKKYDLWIGSVRNECIIFQIKEDIGVHILLTFKTDFNSKNARQIVVKFSSTSNVILTGGEDTIVRLWQLNFTKDKKHVSVINDLYIDKKNAIELLGSYTGHAKSIKDCDISYDDQIICTCSSDNSLKIWNLRSFKILHTEYINDPQKKTEKLNFRCCKFLEKNKTINDFIYPLLATTYASRGTSYLIIWDIYYNDKKEIFKFTKKKCMWLHHSPCCNIAISENEKYIALGFSTGALKIYNSNFSLLAHYQKQELPITAMSFIKNDNYLLATGADYSISCVHVNTFRFRYMRKIGKSIIILFILIIISIILLDFFNVGYDLSMKDLKRPTVQFKPPKSDVTPKKNEKPRIDEL
ncbi:guanine nucleotide-exchange factor SEC12 [Hepatocystis sp. ex Piliocolobus tephrosceles]|nr:guanine nucleotide-exchange factor SEC12 [Hepatocystis sp. ex Piliocolobus tephrosceles]